MMLKNKHKDHILYVCSCSTMIKLFEKFLAKNHAFIFVYPCVVSGITGSIYGGYHSFVFSKKEHYIHNVLCTVTGISLGFAYGAVLGIIWPVSFSVAALRQIVR